MHRLKVPTVMPDVPSAYVVEFETTQQTVLPLGEPASIEEDPYKTASGREFFWAFEREDGLRFQVCWNESGHWATVMSDPPRRRPGPGSSEGRVLTKR